MANDQAVPTQEKVWRKSDIQDLLKRSDRAVIHALVAIYAKQTLAEQSAETTKEHNNVGFTAFDAEFLSSLARQFNERGALTPSQITAARPKVAKYWKQILLGMKEHGYVVCLSPKEPKHV